jgi:predicted transcriptional regulator
MKEVKYPGLVSEMARHGDTQKTIGKIIGITSPNVSMRFSGRVEWSFSEIIKICDYYGKSFEELFRK